jgi:hypothetical protein
LDAAEAWLAANDPDYALARSAWKDINADGEYEMPRQEVPVGGMAEIALLVERGDARHFRAADSRACSTCGELFTPVVSWHSFCCKTCEQRGKKRDRAAYMREYRRRKAA